MSIPLIVMEPLVGRITPVIALIVVGVGGFALVWFVIKKKTWVDFVAVFKKN